MLIFPEPRDLTNATAHALDLTWQRMWCGDKGFPGKARGKVMISFLRDALESTEQGFFVFRCVAAPKGLCVEQKHRILFRPEIKWMPCLNAHPKMILFVTLFTDSCVTCKDPFPQPTCSATRAGFSGAGKTSEGVRTST